LLDPPKGAEENCYIGSAAHVRALLREVAASGARAAAYFDDDKSFIHTSLLAVTTLPARLVFEQGPDAALNAKLLAADKLTFVTSHEYVPVQFSCRAPALIRFNGIDAFRAALPQRVLRLQRRGYYRLPGEPTHALLKCELVPDNDENRLVQAAVFDLSCGGLAAAARSSAPVLARGSTHGCRLELPGVGTIGGQVTVRAVSDIVLPSGLPGRRYGLEFAGLAAKELSLVESYILDRRARNAR
jgi:c-di-GMP-binding flagellar brake protein YcgR